MPAAVPAGGTMVSDVAVTKATTVGALLRGQAGIRLTGTAGMLSTMLQVVVVVS